MSRARPAHRSFAVAAAVLLAALATIPAQAAAPGREHVRVASRRARLGPADRRRPEPPDRHVQTGDDARPPARTRCRPPARARRRSCLTAGPWRCERPPDAPRRSRRPSAPTRTSCASASTIAAIAPPTRPANRTGASCGVSRTWARIAGYPRIYGAVDVDIDARQALGITTGDPATVVAVIDDGVDFSHPDLAARAWTNPGESGAGRETNGIDDDANGYIDDIHGWDFCHDDNTVHDFDDDGHGTHVAGTLAASLNGVGVVGVAPSISIMALKFIGNDPDCGLDSAAIAAIDYAKSFGVTIVNASWGGRGRPQDALELYDAIADSGMLFVAAAGNDGDDSDTDPLPSLPAAFDLPNIVSVAAIDNSGGLAWFSNYGATTVDIAAPGEGILSALPADSELPAPGWGWLDGTSMAAPHVSGTAALVASVFPSLAADPAALKARLLSTGKPDAATTGQTLTGRLVDAFRSLDTVGPLAVAPSGFAFDVGATMGRSTIATRVAWPSATDDRSGVAAYGLQAAGRGRIVGDRRRVDHGAERDADAHVRNDIRLPRPRP